jgi:PHD/YefM family antitoxin component YafN of YafNO toxin-antitoxin module
MKSTYTIRELQRDTASAVRNAETGALVTITRHQKPAVHLISDARLGALLETLELAGNPDFSAAVENLKAGRIKFRAAAKL